MALLVKWRKYENKEVSEAKSIDEIIGKDLSLEVLYKLKDAFGISNENIITRHDANGITIPSKYILKDGDELIIETTYIPKGYNILNK